MPACRHDGTPRLPLRQAHRDRRRFRTTDNRRTRAPSIGLTRTLRSERAPPHLLFTCMASPRTLSPATIPSRLVKGRRSASGYPFASGSRWGYPRRSPWLRERCVSPTSATDFTSRAPCGLLDSRLCPMPYMPYGTASHTGSPWAKGRTVTGLGTSTPLAGRTNQVELRLTANLQLQPLPQLVTWEVPTYSRPSAVLAEPRSTAPLRRTSRSGRFRPRTEHATKHLTSSPAIPGGSDPTGCPAKPHPRHRGPLDPPMLSPRQRTTTSLDQDAFHQREHPPLHAPRQRRRSRTTQRITGSPPVSLLACSWLSPLRSGSSAASPRSFLSFL